MSETKDTEDVYEKYRTAGRIHKEVAESIKQEVKVGTRIIDLCEKIETLIKEKGGKCAFPANISINNIAAHYTSPSNDESVIKEGDVVKVDFGVHVDGYIADGAFTVCFNPEYEKLVEAAEKALQNAIENIKPKANTGKIGEIIEKTIKSYGYRPIKDLTGHILDQYNLHGSKIIPNVKIPYGKEIKEGEVYAVETFATTGLGAVKEMPQAYIYSMLPVRTPARFSASRRVISEILKEYKTLPFAQRWLAKKIPMGSLRLALKELTTKGIIKKYHVLSDIKESFVAQAEHTLIVTKDGCEVTTQ
ncbi:MAG: type II methionyl aminopeptidase [Candidatus Odinarchaeia archaeon]